MLGTAAAAAAGSEVLELCCAPEPMPCHGRLGILRGLQQGAGCWAAVPKGFGMKGHQAQPRTLQLQRVFQRVR